MEGLQFSLSSLQRSACHLLSSQTSCPSTYHCAWCYPVRIRVGRLDIGWSEPSSACHRSDVDRRQCHWLGDTCIFPTVLIDACTSNWRGGHLHSAGHGIRSRCIPKVVSHLLDWNNSNSHHYWRVGIHASFQLRSNPERAMARSHRTHSHLQLSAMGGDAGFRPLAEK
jgi:hypothetical protein